MLVAMLGIFAADALVTYLQLKERERWVWGKHKSAAVIDAVSAAAIGVSIILLAEYTWITLPASIAGVLAGRWLAWRY